MMQRLLMLVLDWSPVVFAWIVAVAMVLIVGRMMGF